MTERKFRPGRQRRFTEGKMSKNRLAWLSTYIGQFVLMYYATPEETEDSEKVESEPGPTLRLMLPQQRGRSIMFNLTALTHEELVKLKELFDIMFSIAEPIVKQRDKAARDAFDRGDDSFIRSYRQVPLMVVRPWAFTADGQGVLQRPDNDDAGDRVDGDEGVVSDAGVPLADGEPEDGLAEDDDPQTD